MKNLLAALAASILFLLVIPVALARVHAATLNFGATTAEASVGETLSVPVIVDAGGEKITSVDAYVTYDSTVLEASEVADGTFFPTVFNDITTERVYVAGMVDDPATFKEGSGTVGTITFTVLKNGSTTLAYKCETGATETSKVIKNDFDATNVINCAGNGTLAVSVGGVAVEPTEAPTSLPTTGTFENVMSITAIGGILVLVGFAARMFL